MKMYVDESTGYLIITGIEHPDIKRYNYVYYHRYLLEKHLGRRLKTTEHTHHINGNKLDNRIENLTLTTSSKHTSTHKGVVTPRKCKHCDKTFKPKQNSIAFCSKRCSELNQRKFEVTRIQLKELVWKVPTTKVAKIFNVSDKAIEKRCKLLKIEKPPRGYWQKRV